MTHQIVSHDEWLAARKAHLATERELTRLRGEMTRQRRELPWVKVEKEYAFEGADGKESLADLFDGRSQLIVYHFMFGPDWKEGCPGCSLLADHLDGVRTRLAQRDVTLVVVSRAPLAKIEAFKQSKDWHFKWVSSHGSDFNYDYHVSFTPEEKARGEVYYNFDLRKFESDELPGTSVFCNDAAGDVFHTYSVYGDGGDLLVGTFNFLDLTPKGRDQDC